MCIVYIAYMGTVVLIVKISVIGFAHCVDREYVLYFLHVVFTCIVYISHISKYDQLSSRCGPDNMGRNHLFVNCTFLCHFF